MIFTFQNLSVSDGLLSVFRLPESWVLVNTLHVVDILETEVRGLWMLLFLSFSIILCLVPENNYRKLLRNNALWMLVAAGAFVWSFLCLDNESIFVYFNF